MKRFLAGLISALMLSAIGANAAPAGGYSPQNDTVYRDSFFLEDNTVLDEGLALSSAALAVSAYSGSDVSAHLQSLGFASPRVRNYRAHQGGIQDYVASAMSFKRVTALGRVYDLFVIALRGTVDPVEWLSNLTLGLEDHAGFSMAANDVIMAFRDYYTELAVGGFIDNDVSNNRLWVTGHSRGAAVANVAAVYLKDYFMFSENAVYAYTFACPNVTREDIIPGSFRYIFNFVFKGDVVPYLPPEAMGYHRCGITRELGVLSELFGRTIILYRDYTGETYDAESLKDNHDCRLYLCWMAAASGITLEPADGVHARTAPPDLTQGIHDPALLGSWEQDVFGIRLMSLTFNGDGAMALTALGLTIPGTYSASGGMLTMALDLSDLAVYADATGLSLPGGTSGYSVSGNVLYLDGMTLTKMRTER